MAPEKKKAPVRNKKGNQEVQATRLSPRFNCPTSDVQNQPAEDEDKNVTTRSSGRFRSRAPYDLQYEEANAKKVMTCSSGKMRRPPSRLENKSAEEKQPSSPSTHVIEPDLNNNNSSLNHEEPIRTKDELPSKSTTGPRELPIQCQIGDHIWNTSKIPRNFFVTGYPSNNVDFESSLFPSENGHETDTCILHHHY